MKYYKLNADHSIEETDLIGWGRTFETDGNRAVGRDNSKRYFVSTVFLGIDHNVGNLDGDKPHLFETMVFDKKARLLKSEVEQIRYATWDEAVQGHLAMCHKYKVRSTSLLS